MPIEFDCVRCRARLRITEEVLGQKTQCPYCQEIQIVAHAAQNGSTDAEANATGPGKLTPTRVQFTILYGAWMIFCARIGSFLILGLIAFGINVLAILSSLLAWYIESLEKHGLEPHAVTIAYISCYLFWLLGNILLFLGGIRYSLHLVRGGQQRLSLLIPRAGQVFKLFLHILVFGILYLIFLIPAFALQSCIIYIQSSVPNSLGLSLAVAYSFSLYVAIFSPFLFARFAWGIAFLVDRDEGPVQALLSSYAYSTGSTWALARNLFVVLIGGLIFFCCTCRIGYILVMPLVCCYIAVVYLAITGQPFPRPVSVGPPRQPPAPLPPVENDGEPLPEIENEQV